jgi:hypothetical protein
MRKFFNFKSSASSDVDMKVFPFASRHDQREVHLQIFVDSASVPNERVERLVIICHGHGKDLLLIKTTY